MPSNNVLDIIAFIMLTLTTCVIVKQFQKIVEPTVHMKVIWKSFSIQTQD